LTSSNPNFKRKKDENVDENFIASLSFDFFSSSAKLAFRMRPWNYHTQL